jgi:hypothetical protein
MKKFAALNAKVLAMKHVKTEIDIRKEIKKLKENTELLRNDINITQYAVESSLKAIFSNHEKARNVMSFVQQRIKANLTRN